MNCPKFSPAFLLETRDRKCHLFSRHLLLLVTHPALVAAATKEAFTCPKTSPVNQRLKSSVMLWAVSPHSALFTSICFQEFHPSGGLSVEGRPALVTFGRQALSCPPPQVSVYILPSLLLENVCSADSRQIFILFFLVVPPENAVHSATTCQAHVGRCSPFNLLTYPLNRFYYSPVTSYC